MDPEIEEQKRRIATAERSELPPGSAFGLMRRKRQRLSSTASLMLPDMSFFSAEDDDIGAFDGGLPTFECAVRPARKPQTTDISVVPGFQDLVFNIVYKDFGNGFRVKRIEIKIPMEGVEGDEWLTEKYDANSVTMRRVDCKHLGLTIVD